MMYNTCFLTIRTYLGDQSVIAKKLKSRASLSNRCACAIIYSLLALSSLFKASSKMSSSMNSDDTANKAVIQYLLNKIDTLPSASDARVIACNELLTYIATQALQFTLRHHIFKNVVIDKCITFKDEAYDNIHNTHYADLAETCTSLWTLLVFTLDGDEEQTAATVKQSTPRRSPRLANKQRVVYAL